MKNIFRFLAGAKGAVAVIVGLLIIQAYCDLSLPSYTRDLLNIGLQQNGIADAVPDTIRAESLEMLELFLSDEDTEKAEAAYSEADEEGIRSLKKITADEREALDGILALPESVVFQMGNSEEGAKMLEMAKSVLTQIFHAQEEKGVTPERILALVSDQYGVSVEDLLSKKRSREIAQPRQIAMYLCRKLTQLSTTNIGLALGGRDHTTVMHGCEKVEEDMERDLSFKRRMEELMERVRNG